MKDSTKQVQYVRTETAQYREHEGQEKIGTAGQNTAQSVAA
jgi:hypothetical protein